MAAPGQALAHHLLDLLRRTLAYRPGDHAGLAEAAAPGAASEDLDVQPVVDDLGQWNEGSRRIGPVRQVCHRPLGHFGRDARLVGEGRDQATVAIGGGVEGGDVDPFDRRQSQAQLLPIAAHGRFGQPIADGHVDLAHDLFAVTQGEGVDEVCQGFGIERAVAAGDDPGVVGTPIGGMQGNLGQIEQIDDVGVDELGRKIESHDIEVAGRNVLLHAEERHAGRPHGRLHVHPGRVGALGYRIGPLVEDLVEDLQPLVGEPDLVRVGVKEHPGDLARTVLRVLRPLLTPDIARRLGDAEQ